MGTSLGERHGGEWTAGFAAFAAAICLVMVAPALAQAASAPTIDSTSVARIRQHAAAIEAQIDPEGSATTYEVWIWPGCSAGFCERGPPYVAATGHIPAGSGDRVVSAWVNELEAGTSNNGYWVVATNASGTSESAQQVFATPPAVAEPAVEGESVADITQSDATLEAKINPEGLDYGAYYQFQVVRNTSEYLPELVCFERGVELAIARDGCLGPPSAPPGAIPLHYISGGAEGQQISLDLASVGMTLLPGTTYHYRVLAAKHLLSEDTVHWEGPATVGPDQTFTTPPPGGTPVIEPPSSPVVLPPSGGGQPPASGDGAQSVGLGSLSFSSPLGLGVTGGHKGKTTKPSHSPSKAQKLAKALKLCEKKPKRQRASCAKQAHKRYGTSPAKGKKG